MKITSKKKLLATLFMTAVMVTSATANALACTTLYVGGDLTEAGVPIVARSEDYVNSQNKLFYVSPAGRYKAGETYLGCAEYGGFTRTMLRDSYRFTAFKADNLNGTCPECGLGTAENPVTHATYEESGTNEMGVTVSATETISGNPAICGNTKTADIPGIDPYHNKGYKAAHGIVGIEETDIPTVILSEAASARDGVRLLCDIYDTYGCAAGAGLFIADQDEIWYIENCSGTQYIALKLNSNMIFLEPNMAVIGRIDLDDTDNVIYSKDLIKIAKDAGTFVGDEANNIIDFRASYGKIAVSSKNRLSNGLNFINKSYYYTEDSLFNNNSLFTISNMDANNNTVALYTNISADRKITVDDVVNYFKVDGIANTGNTDTAFFQIYSKKERSPEFDTVEWVSLNHGAYNVFIPYYPMLLTDTYEGYKVHTEVAKSVAEAPTSGMYYRTSADGKYTVLPENWKDSYYWCFDALSNYILNAEFTDGAVSDADKEYVLKKLSDLQQEIYAEFNTMNATSTANIRKVATKTGMDMAKKAHLLALELTEYVTGSAPSAQ